MCSVFTRAPVPYDREAWSDGGHETDQNGTTSGIFGFKHIGLYAYTKSFLLRFSRLKASRLENLEKLEQLRILENGYSIRVTETERNSIGVDRLEDLNTIERLLCKNK